MVCGPNAVHGAIASGPWASLQVWKFGSKGMVAINTATPALCQMPKPQYLGSQLEPSYAPFPHGAGPWTPSASGLRWTMPPSLPTGLGWSLATTPSHSEGPGQTPLPYRAALGLACSHPTLHSQMVLTWA